MIAYLIRRLLYAIPILIGVNLLTFALFFVVNTPDDMARMQLGLAIALPTFMIGLAVYVSFALLMTLFRATALDIAGVALCVLLMSVSGLFYIIGGQFLVSKLGHLVPLSGYAGGADSLRFVVLPVVIGVAGGVGSSSRWDRPIFLEAAGKAYVRA